MSVVIATHDRRARIARTLDALAVQVGAPPFEVVVVDDGSADGTYASLQARSGDPYPLTVLRQDPNRGPATARNLGWRTAKAPLVCFTDDDCTPEPGWLAALATAASGVDIAQGRTIPDPDQAANRGPFSRTMTVPFEEGFYETCNIAYRRDLLEQLDGFDQGFRYPYGEDTDLAWRARELGARTTFVDAAVVRHEVWPSDYRAQLRDMRRRDGLVLMYAKHPQLRRHFRRKLFFREIHPATTVTALCLAVLVARPGSIRRWAVAASSGLWYAWMCRRARPNPPRRSGWAVVVPLAFVADAYEIAVMARASVKYRTILL